MGLVMHEFLPINPPVVTLNPPVSAINPPVVS